MQADGGMEFSRFSRLDHLGHDSMRSRTHSILETSRKNDIMGGKDKYRGLPGVHAHR
jgi:hypothetical protein